MIRNIVSTFLMLMSSVTWQNALAQDADPVELDTLEVRGTADSNLPQSQPGSRLSGDALRLKVSSTLGETLSDELGVNNAAFGPGVGLPVLRGLTGSRVRLMQDGIASHDASTISPDHASSLDASLAEEIQIIRGPAVLKYGGGAVGGVVNVIDNRIPETLPLAPLTGSIESRYSSNANTNNTSMRIDAGKGRVALHGDGFYRRNKNTRIPGDALDIAALNEQFGEDDYVTSTDRINNTFAEAYGGSVGASIVGDRGFAGFSANASENDYGIPPGVHVDLGIIQNVRLKARQKRYDFKSQLLDIGDSIPELNLRAGYIDYQLDESESGKPGTVFSNEVWEAQASIDHVLQLSSSAAFEGDAGFQLMDRDFSALGVEAFVPRSSQQLFGAYLIEKLELPQWRFEFGARAEVQRITQNDAIDCAGLNTTFQRERSDFTNVSYSGAIHWRFRPSAWASLSLSRAQRSPDIQELLTCGPHLSTQTYDVAFNLAGTDSSGLEQETFHTLNLGLHWDAAWFSFELDIFHNEVNDFIYQRNLSTATNGPFYNPEKLVFQGTCASASQCFPVMQYTQQDASMSGYEVQIEWPLRESMTMDWTMTLFSDYVRAQLDGGEDVPRMPPLRLGAALGARSIHLNGELRFTYAMAQNNPGENETSTDAYNLLNASMSYTRHSSKVRTTFFASARNLLDEEIRNSTSFLRNYAPEPGRGFELGMRLEY